MTQMNPVNQTIIAPVSAPATTTAAAPEQAYFLSEILGIRVMLNGQKVGKLTDLVIKENGSLPVVTHLLVALPFGLSALIPWEKIGKIGPKEVTVEVEDLSPYKGEPEDNAVLLKDHILDKKAIDLEGRDMDAVSYTHLTLPTILRV